MIKRIAKGGNFKNPCKRVLQFDSIKIGRDLKMHRNESLGVAAYVFAKQDCPDGLHLDRPGIVVSRNSTLDEVHAEVFRMWKDPSSELEFAEVRAYYVSGLTIS